MDNIKIGVIGCGKMGINIVQRLLAHDDRLQVVAIFDPDPRSLEAAVELLGSTVRICADYREVVSIPEIQWIMIASWNCDHCAQTVAAFEAGKHVFCQKPLALSVEECRLMRDAWQRSGRMFNIGFTLRYSPHYRKIKQLISEGRIGQIISMEFNETLEFNHGGYIMGDWRRLRKNAGTHLLEKCCHDIDLVNWMVGARAERVASFGGLDFFVPRNAHRVDEIPAQADGKKAYTTWGGLVALDPFLSDKDIVDNQVAIIEYENGVRATFHTNCNAAIPERRMYILGTEGAIRADVLTGTIHLKRIGFDTQLEDLSTEAKGGHGSGDGVLVIELAESMLRRTPPSVGLVEGLESAVTCFAIDEAMDLGAVVDVRQYWDRIDKMKPNVEYLPDDSVDVALDQELRDLLSTCFTKPGDEVFRQRRYFVTPYPHRWILRDAQGAIVAHVGVHDRHVEADGQSFRIGGIAEVCVHPDHRRRGYVRMMLEQIHAWLHERGFVFAMLFGEASVYGSSGYKEARNIVYGDSGTGWKQTGGMVKELTQTPWPDTEVRLSGQKF
ncbi:GNAT family N-acetyltransferase [Candidatus Sumerlaeota bacterium]|nr:GNAT family N-acetyltransferase [Candidatus Sumerlaeota bacterium]